MPGSWGLDRKGNGAFRHPRHWSFLPPLVTRRRLARPSLLQDGAKMARHHLLRWCDAPRPPRKADLPAQRPGISAGAAAALASPRGPRSAQHHAADGPAAQPAGSDDRIGGGAREIAAGELPGADSVMVGEAEGGTDVVEVVHVLPIVAPERVVARNVGAVTIGGVSGEDICGSEGGGESKW
jgi:hypothetical protein